jgi:hypothetical protein
VPERVLTLRDLNRATLSRQMLLARGALPVAEAVGRLVGLQAQVPNPPYVGLWTRVKDFRREDLTGLMQRREVVRVAAMRSTLHLMEAEDYLDLWPALRPALVRALSSFFGRKIGGLDTERVAEEARAAFEGGPQTFAELRARLLELEPDRDGAALAYAARTYLPLVQVPPAGTWGSGGSPSYALAGSWLGREPEDRGAEDLRNLVFRYLAAFGPATAKDVQAWSGLARLKEPIAGLKPELRVYRDEDGNELLDLPGAPEPEETAELPAPPRFVPEYDNLVLSHADRRRVISDEHRKGVFLSAARVRATFLIDGFVCGAWKIEKSGGTATLVVEPFESLSARDRDVLVEEGERLVRFVEEGADRVEVRFARDT